MRPSCWEAGLRIAGFPSLGFSSASFLFSKQPSREKDVIMCNYTIVRLEVNCALQYNLKNFCFQAWVRDESLSHLKNHFRGLSQVTVLKQTLVSHWSKTALWKTSFGAPKWLPCHCTNGTAPRTFTRHCILTIHCASPQNTFCTECCACHKKYHEDIGQECVGWGLRLCSDLWTVRIDFLKTFRTQLQTPTPQATKSLMRSQCIPTPPNMLHDAHKSQRQSTNGLFQPFAFAVTSGQQKAHTSHESETTVFFGDLKLFAASLCIQPCLQGHYVWLRKQSWRCSCCRTTTPSQ